MFRKVFQNRSEYGKSALSHRKFSSQSVTDSDADPAIQHDFSRRSSPEGSPPQQRRPKLKMAVIVFSRSAGGPYETPMKPLWGHPMIRADIDDPALVLGIFLKHWAVLLKRPAVLLKRPGRFTEIPRLCRRHRRAVLLNARAVLVKRPAVLVKRPRFLGKSSKTDRSMESQL